VGEVKHAPFVERVTGQLALSGNSHNIGLTGLRNSHNNYFMGDLGRLENFEKIFARPLAGARA
jgi:hypothetical protein